MKTEHNIFIGNSQNMIQLEDNSVDLIVTSPPYPMIKMWDDMMIAQNKEIDKYLEKEPMMAFELMHQILDKVWTECFRVLKPGGFLCINIGDATRTIGEQFSLYNNHSRVVKKCIDLGFVGLPNIIWRKQTNAPNKFMGSGTLPCGAYVTLEHEWILIFRKGGKRLYKTANEKSERLKSSIFWEERNIWFSDVWNIKGTKQNIKNSQTRTRSAAFPVEIPFRLINMFSQNGDVVLDPFLGTGTTTIAAILAGRNSYGYEIDNMFEAIVREGVENLDINLCNHIIMNRLVSHEYFVKNRENLGKQIKYFNENLNCKVMTKQETNLELNIIKSLSKDDPGRYLVEYEKL